MKPIDLQQMTDGEIEAAVAEHIAGWQRKGLHSVVAGEIFADCWIMPDGLESRPLSYLTDANAVLRLLDRQNLWRIERDWRHIESNTYTVTLWKDGCEVHTSATTFNRAACYALLRSVPGLVVKGQP